MRLSTAGRPLRGLALACHPLPCLAVTAFATAYALRVGASAGTAAGIAAAALAGQLTVGWVNDAWDADRDRQARRPDKPVALGLVNTRTVWIATGLVTVIAVLLSLRLGLRAGLLHLVAVGSAQAYNLRLKFGLLSPLPYVVAFALLPVVTTAAVHQAGDTDRSWPPLLHVLAAGLLGAAAHAGNTVGDAEADARTGVRGLPQLLGPRVSLLAMAGLVGLAAVLALASLLTRTWTGPHLLGAATLAAGAAFAVTVAFARPSLDGGRLAWRLTLASVALVVVGFLLAA